MRTIPAYWLGGPKDGHTEIVYTANMKPFDFVPVHEEDWAIGKALTAIDEGDVVSLDVFALGKRPVKSNYVHVYAGQGGMRDGASCIVYQHLGRRERWVAGTSQDTKS